MRDLGDEAPQLAAGRAEEVPEPPAFHLGEDGGREVREAEGDAGAPDEASLRGREAAGEPGLGVVRGAGGQVEGVLGVEHVVAVGVGLPAGGEEVECGFVFLRGGGDDSAVCAAAAGFGLGGRGRRRRRALEDGSEEFAGGVSGRLVWLVRARVDVAGDEGVFHDCVSDLGR